MREDRYLDMRPSHAPPCPPAIVLRLQSSRPVCRVAGGVPFVRMKRALPFILLLLAGCLVLAGAVAFSSVECPYCHNSDANKKGACLKRQRDGSCREDYYDTHYNLSSCPWCRSRGSMSRLDAFLD